MAWVRDLQSFPKPPSPRAAQSRQDRLEVRLVAVPRPLRLEEQGNLGRESSDFQSRREAEQTPPEPDPGVPSVDPLIAFAFEQKELDVPARWRMCVDLVDRQVQPLALAPRLAHQVRRSWHDLLVVPAVQEPPHGQLLRAGHADVDVIVRSGRVAEEEVHSPAARNHPVGPECGHQTSYSNERLEPLRAAFACGHEGRLLGEAA